MKYCTLTLLYLLLVICPQSLGAESRKVGVIAPLSGPLADVGETVRQSVLLADEDYDAHSKWEFLFEDDQFNSKVTVAAFRKLADINGVQAAISFGSSTSISISDIAERAKLPLFTIGISDKMTEGRRYVFRHFPTAGRQHSAIRQEMVRRGYKRIALVTMAQDAMLNMRELMLADSPAEIAFSEEVLPSDNDFRSIAARIKAKEPDAVYLLVLAPNLSTLARQLRDIGYGGQFFAAAHLQTKAEVVAARGALEGAWFATADDGPSADFVSRYYARFHTYPHPDGMHAYDIAKILIGIGDSADILSAVQRQSEFHGIFGRYSLGDKNTFELPVMLKTVKEGTFVALHPNS
ncbi:MAG: ABC transporter substrate-binding protein [Bdellovibrionota bacterium]|nr:MAG: ABC transporter substrate-binding protein [Bdellovibrionota bacterium]